jgi:hypothetical protein
VSYYQQVEGGPYLNGNGTHLLRGVGPSF